MIFYWISLSLLVGVTTAQAQWRAGVNQMHIAYLGKQERSISWTSLTEIEPMELKYQLMVIGPQVIG
jgi:hypothetical protein